MTEAGGGDGSGRRSSLASALEERSPGLSSLYLSATAHLDESPKPGFEVSRVSIICHCLRELMLGVLRTLLIAPEERPSPTSHGLADRLNTIIGRNPGLDLYADQDLIPVPKKVARTVAELAKTVSQERGRNRRNLAALITGDTHASHSSMLEWTDAYNFFVKWAHVDQHHSNLPSDRVILDHLAIIEQIIETRLNEFFENLRSVEDLLLEANRQETW